jgi:hypothetical protein
MICVLTAVETSLLPELEKDGMKNAFTNDLARALAQREKETSLADETSYGRDLTNCPYTAIRDESLLPSANLLDTTVRIRTASFSLN